MALAGFGGIFRTCVAFALAVPLVNSVAIASDRDLPTFQGAWLIQGPACSAVYASTGREAAFRKPVDIFAPAFIVSGNRLRTPMASCRIKSIVPTGDRKVLALDCANAVAGGEVKVIMSTMPDGSLRRHFNEQDTTGTQYVRCP